MILPCGVEGKRHHYTTATGPTQLAAQQKGETLRGLLMEELSVSTGNELLRPEGDSARRRKAIRPRRRPGEFPTRPAADRRGGHAGGATARQPPRRSGCPAPGGGRGPRRRTSADSHTWSGPTDTPPS